MNERTTLTVEERPGGLKVLHIHGDLDTMGTQMVRDELVTAITVSDTTKNVLIDLDDVSFISSAGMALLLVSGKRLRRDGIDLILAAVDGRIFEVLSLAGFQELFNVYKTIEEAMSSLKKDSP